VLEEWEERVQEGEVKIKAGQKDQEREGEKGIPCYFLHQFKPDEPIPRFSPIFFKHGDPLGVNVQFNDNDMDNKLDCERPTQPYVIISYEKPEGGEPGEQGAGYAVT
jgi:hypothetical protein